MEINEYEAGMLDAVLEAFAGRAELDWTHLLELFDGDEQLAAAITDILAGVELIVKSGEEATSGLPEKILRTDAVAPFLADGGFTAQIKKPAAAAIEKPEPNKEVVFEIENKLPEETPTHEEEVLPLAPVESAPPLKEIVHSAPEPEKPSTDVLLHQEIAQLRFDQRQFEHALREKDMAIETLTRQNETLSRFRIFIWVLLGIIAVIVIELIFYRHR